MKTKIMLLILVLSSSFSFCQSDNEDQKAIKKVIQSAYVEGIQNEGNASKIEAGFHPEFRLLGLGNNNKMWTLPIAQWKQNALKKRQQGKLPRTNSNLYKVEFEMIDITNKAAIVKLRCYIGTEQKYVDYISLYKFGNEWKIVNKIFENI